jgi:hypothetical protein
VSREMLPKWNLAAWLPGLSSLFTFSKFLSLKWKLKDTGNIHKMWHWGVFLQHLLPRNINKHYLFWVCFCSFRYPACNAHASYCHLWPVRMYSIFPHYLIKSTIFESRFLNIKMYFFIFSTTFVWNISHYKKNWARYDKKCLLVFM